MTRTIEELAGVAPVLPVVVVDDAEDAVPLAAALVSGGLPLIEVTLRSDAALAAIERIAADVPDAVVGAGTVVSAQQISDVMGAGAQFLVSPGITPGLLDGLQASGLPFLAGVSSASEVVALLERGIRIAKFFPAETAGGVAMLRALAGPFPEMRFCPTGGIDAVLAPYYLALSNVACVGGSWVAPSSAIVARDWDRIERLARVAAMLSSGTPA